ncbi:hypothetical protein C8Q76DRAFT_597069, partial [Earliella scabrosa]
APIHTIPDELLLVIFQLVLCQPPHSRVVAPSGESRDGIEVSMILGITHVCKRWRAVAIGYPCLWSCIGDRHLELLELFLVRSLQIPLSLHLRSDTPGLRNILSICGRRVQRMDLGVSPNFPHVQDLLKFEPTSLQCLTIAYDDDTPRLDEELGSVLLFDQDSVHLKALAIHRGHHWLPSNVFPQLTHLHLELAPGR